MSVYICGDVHGDFDLSKITSKTWKEQRELTREDYLIILGDFGVPWSNNPDDRFDKKMIEWYNNKRMTILFLPGNHENYERLSALPNIEKFGSFVRQLSDNIFMLNRGFVYNIDNKKIFAMGGGESIDKNRRRNRVSWWEEEIPSYTEIMRAKDNLKKSGGIDYILTHTCSNRVFKKLNNIIDLSSKDSKEKGLRDFFDWIEDNVSFNSWHFGHFHNDLKVDDKHFCWYNSLPIELK